MDYNIRQHWAIQTRHTKLNLLSPQELFDLISDALFWGGKDWSAMIAELNKYPQNYYRKNMADNNLYNFYNVPNVIWNWEGNPYYITSVNPKTWRNYDAFVAYNSNTQQWEWYIYWWWELQPF